MKRSSNHGWGRSALMFLCALVMGVTSLGPTQTADGQTGAASTEAAVGAPASGGPTLLSKPFRLRGESMRIAMAEETSEVETLWAQTNVLLEMEEIAITGHELEYDAETQLLYTYRNEEDRVLVRQGDTLIFCDEFEYNASTGDFDPKGDPQWRIVQKNGQIIRIEGGITKVRNIDGLQVMTITGNGTVETEGFKRSVNTNERRKMTTIKDGKTVEISEEEGTENRSQKNVSPQAQRSSKPNSTARSSDRTILPSPD